MKYDRELSIATANSRRAKSWKNKTITWTELRARLRETTRTAETMAEYRKMPRDRQADIKDVGGFVGGYCKNGRRTDVSVRSVLTLDADFAEPSLWDAWELMRGAAAVIYSTHKHTEEKPRVRLVVPLARDVSPDEYQAIGRRIASELGIDQFDDTSYQAARLMYWPSTSADGVFYFRENVDGPLLEPDEVLATYRDWKDASAWPMSSRVTDIVRKSGEKQADPLGKPGLVGAFCRAYTIEEAIEAYIPQYIPCDEPGRYTYADGSTSAGVIIYEHKFSFSHHATDPASGVLCNAWDLVRLHRFGSLDAETDEGTRANSKQSYKAMAALVSGDARVSALVVSDRMADAEVAFSAPVTDGADWKQRLKLSDKGALQQTIENVVTILTGDPSLAGRLAYNELSHDIVARSSLPWREVNGESQWIDADDAALRFYLERVYGLQGKDRIFDAVNVVAQSNKFHPVRDYLDACPWDGVPRLDTLLIDYLGAVDSEYTRAVTRKTLVAAVARIFRPGCKFDNMLTLRGRQGIGKSALIAKLAGSWFSDSFGTMQGKEAYEQVQGVWIVEVGELAGMRKSEADTIKLYISKQEDRFRPAYGRRIQSYPRQCIFIGTTNETQFLRDSTGNRRFWVVDTPNQPARDMWAELTDELVAQIWGEAVHRFRDGETLYLSRRLERMAAEVQRAYEEENPRAGLIEDYVERLLPSNWSELDLYARRQWLDSASDGTERRETVSTVEIWAEALGGNPEKLDRYAVKEIRDVLNGLTDWRDMGTKLVPTLYGRQKHFRRCT